MGNALVAIKDTLLVMASVLLVSTEILTVKDLMEILVFNVIRAIS